MVSLKQTFPFNLYNYNHYRDFSFSFSFFKGEPFTMGFSFKEITFNLYGLKSNSVCIPKNIINLVEDIVILHPYQRHQNRVVSQVDQYMLMVQQKCQLVFCLAMSLYIFNLKLPFLLYRKRKKGVFLVYCLMRKTLSIGALCSFRKNISF